MKTSQFTRIANGTYTLINRGTGTYMTVKIHTAQKGNLEGKRIVSKMVGCDNENSFKGMAFVTPDDTIRLWRKAENEANTKIVTILWSLIILNTKSPFAKLVDMKLSKKCLRCNRKLTTPKSIQDGIGPECIKKM